MASKQRRPEQEHQTEPNVERAPAAGVDGPGLESGAALSGPLAQAAAQKTAFDGAGPGRAERIAQALSVAPRVAELTRNLVETVERSALPEDRKAEIRERLLADQQAADTVAEAVTRAFGRDDPELRSALVEAARGADEGKGEQALAEAIAAHTGHSVESARGLCDELQGWVATWWDEEEEEEGAPPGDYAAEESGS